MAYDDRTLAASSEMDPVHGSVDLELPTDVLWEVFARPNLWPRWNKCFFWVYNKELQLGRRLIWCFQPIKRWLPYKMPAIAEIVELEPLRKVTWQVTALPRFYARHTYYVADLGGGRSRFGSWEKATGLTFQLMKGFWIRHFEFVKEHSIKGANELEAVYRRNGAINEQTLKPVR